MRMNFEHVFLMPDDILGPARLRANVVLGKNPTGGKEQRILSAGALFSRYVFGNHELAFASYELSHVHRRSSFRSFVITRPLNAAEPIQLLETDAAERWGQSSDFIHYFRRVIIVHGVTHRVHDCLGDLPIGHTCCRGHHFAHQLNAALRVSEGAVFFKKCRTRQKNMRQLGGFV